MSSKQKGVKGVRGYDEGEFRVPLDHLLNRISQRFSTNSPRCIYNAPYLAVIQNGQAFLLQGCCKSWYCPRCSVIYAAYHKHRMIEGVQELLKFGPVYFWTITCRGKELDLETADDDYLLWTNRLLARCRGQARYHNERWAYVQVTERQERGAAHSHFLHTWVPRDSVFTTDRKGVVNLSSGWFVRANTDAGLGPQCKISQVQSAASAGSYVAKYLQKHLSDAVWPEHWRRIRYSQDFPDTTEPPEFAHVLISRDDWQRLEGFILRTKQRFTAVDERTYQFAHHRIIGVDRPKQAES